MRLGRGQVALVACGALSTHAGRLIEAHGWPIDIHPVNPLVHVRPERITDLVAGLVDRLTPDYERVVVGFADCGTYGTLAQWCRERGIPLIEGLHCYDMYAGQGATDALIAEQPGTFVLTDFMVLSFDRIVVKGLGLDRYPELHDDYFRHYTRVVWRAQDRTPELEARAREQAAWIGAPLEVVETGLTELERVLQDLLAA